MILKMGICATVVATAVGTFYLNYLLINFSFERIHIYAISTKNLVFVLSSTPDKAWESVNMARFGPYTWSGCEQGRGNFGNKILSLAHAKGMTALGRK